MKRWIRRLREQLGERVGFAMTERKRDRGIKDRDQPIEKQSISKEINKMWDGITTKRVGLFVKT